MLTRLKVDGFKNLLGVDISFGPFTCIAGANGAGKSNLFDAIRFLSALVDMPLIEAARSVRGEGARNTDVSSLFHRVANQSERQMRFEVEMLIPREGVDDLGQEAEATMTFLSYRLQLGLTDQEVLVVESEELFHINKGSARAHLPFEHKPAWRNSVVQGRRTSPFISTDSNDGKTLVKIHQDGGGEYLGGGRPRPHVAERLPRTVLSTATNAAESPTAVLARREMQSWRLLQLEPSALRAPDSYNAPKSMDADGAHLPATLARLVRINGAYSRHLSTAADDDDHAEAVYAEIANRLSELIDDVHSIRVEADDSRELLRLMLRDRDGTEHEARALSDGTLRFLALAILEGDPLAQGVLCLEEPENGIHPDRIPAMLSLLRDLATDPHEAVDESNPLRQVIVNTHSPSVVQQILDEDLVVLVPELTMRKGHRCAKPRFQWLEETWRAKAWPHVTPLAPGHVSTYLNPVPPAEPKIDRRKARRVIDRPDVQPFLPFVELTA